MRCISCILAIQCNTCHELNPEVEKLSFKNHSSIKEGSAAPYPNSATAEIQSVTVFNGLIDPVYIKADIKVLDKNPNYDGIIEITAGNQLPIGKLEVQIKTLGRKNYANPKYQASREFLSYCYQNNVPVLLIVVNTVEKVAYWLHINEQVIEDVQTRIKGASCAIHFSLEHKIDGLNENYVQQWTAIVQEYATRIRNYDDLKAKHDQMENELTGFRKKLILPSSIAQDTIKVLQIFLDQLNGLLDHEFKAVKAIIYPDYWKIGLALIKYNTDNSTFYLFPLPYGSNEPLIKQITSEGAKDPLSYFRNEKDRGLLFMSTDAGHLRTQPLRLAYGILKSEILKVVKKTQFPVEDPALANEYLTGFIDTFYALLGLSPNKEVYSVSELDNLLTMVLPCSMEARHPFIAADATEIRESLDPHKNKACSSYYSAAIESAKSRIKEGYKSRVKIIVYSNLFSVNLVHYYLNLLQVNGKQDIKRIYKIGQTASSNSPMMWNKWNKQVLTENLHTFFYRFTAIYDRYFQTNFPFLTDELNVFKEADLSIFVLYFKETMQEEPVLEYYGLKGVGKSTKGSRFFLAEDTGNPVNRNAWYTEENRYCRFEDCDYYIYSLRNISLDFMFEASPVYALIQELLTERLGNYLNKRRLFR